MKNLIPHITITIVLMIMIFTSAAPNVKEVRCDVLVYDTLVVHDTVDRAEIYEVKGTHYNATVGQCDLDPLTTADMSKIDTVELNNGELRWVALSRDMLTRWGGPFNYGDTVYVHHDKPDLRGAWIVHDTMNARYNKRIDFLMPLEGKIPGHSRCILISKEPFVIERTKN